MSSDTFNLKLLIDNKRGIVLLAEADDKFIDALTDEVHDTDFLFDVVRQMAPLGSPLVNLCDSYDDLYEASSDSETTPHSDAIYCCRRCFQYHAKEKYPCPDCRSDMSIVPRSVYSTAFVTQTPPGIYMITDDFKYKRMSALSMMNHVLTTRVSVDGPDALEEKMVKLSLDQVEKLVRSAASHSKKVLTDFFLNKTDAESESESESKSESEAESESDADADAEAEADGVKTEEFVVVDQDEAE